NPARSNAARTSRPDRSVGSLAMRGFPAAMPNVRLRGLDFHKLLTCLGGDGIAGIATILDVKLNGFTDVVQSFGARVALADASGQRRNANDVPTIFFPFQNDRVTHWSKPSHFYR